MRIFKSKTFLSYITLLSFLLMTEILFRLVSGGSIFNFSFFRVFILLNIVSLFLGYLTSLVKFKYTRIFNSLIVLVASVYSWLQLGFYNFLGVYISLNTSSQFGAVKDYIVDFLHSMKPLYLVTFIPFVLIVGFYILIANTRKKDTHFRLKRRYTYGSQINFISVALILILLCGAFEYTLHDKFLEDSYQVMSNEDLFKTASNPGLCVKEFGVLSYGLIDVKTKVVGVDEENLIYYEHEGDNSEVDSSREFDDTNWETIISEEKNKTYNNLNNYYINAQITDKNEMTGLFEDKNLIVIMMESVNDVILNEEYFPNFYKLATEGWYFENNYSPRNSCATGNNEFSAMTGLYSIYNSCTSNIYLNNTYSTSIFNLFNNAGYYTNSLHNFTEAYYYRSTIHKNMGSKAYYGVQDLKIPFYTYYGGWASDEDLMNQYLNIVDTYEQDTPFMSFITTVTSHQPYSNSSPYGDMYLDMTEGIGYSKTLRRYMSKLKVLDNSLGILLEGLEQRGILDDTVIVLFGDHYPYGIPLNILNEVLDRDLNNYENEKVPLVIYNSDTEAKQYDTYTSYLNLTPTIANLFNLDFDPRLYAGVDIFSKQYDNIVAFADSSWKNDKAYYNASTGEITYYTDFTYTDEEIKNINSLIYAKMNSSSMSIKNNYFNYLENKLKEVEEREITE
ncbi:MAG: sulfatase-like hydrolase/transferase [Bacilli bacterium]|nr:sulfatase-like hydrolase/transferase [Bacilli bacterium]